MVSDYEKAKAAGRAKYGASPSEALVRDAPRHRSSRKRLLEKVAQQKAAEKAAAEKAAAEKAAADKALLEKMRQQGREQQAKQRAELEKRQRATRGERASLKAREQLRLTALARGKGFTQKEGRDFMKARGGTIKDLRSARRKGFVISAPKKEEVKKKVEVKVDPNLLKKVNVKLDKKIKEFLKTERRQEIGGTKQINASIKTGIQTGKISNELLNVADIISGGYLTERNINKDQADLNKRAIKFNDKFGGKDLSESEFKKAQTEQKFIDSEQKKIDNKTDNLANSKRDLINDFFAKTSIQGKPRLTVAEQRKIEKERQENKKLQNQIKTNQPVINEISKEISNKSKEIIKLQDKKDRTIIEDVKLFKLKNKVDILSTDIARLEFRAPPKVLAGSFDIIPATRIPSGISKMKFIGKQTVGKEGKIVTDIIFQTKSGRTGIARGVVGNASKDGKTISMVAGRSGKVAVKFPTGAKKITKIESFVGAEKTASKSKVLDTITTLAKNGEIPQSKAKKLKAIAEDIFKVDIKKIDLKKLNSLERKLIESRKIKPLDLKKNLQRLKKKGLLGIERKVKKSKLRIGKRTRRGIRPKPRVPKVPKKISPKKIAKKFEAKKVKKPKKKVKIKKPTLKLKIGKSTRKKAPSKPKVTKVPKKISPKKIAKKFEAKKIKVIKKVETITKEDFLKRVKSFRGTGDISKRLEKKLIKKVNKLAKKGEIPKEEFLKIAKRIKKPGAIIKPKKKIGKKTRGRIPSKPKVPKVPKRISPKKIAKRFEAKKVKKVIKIGKKTRRRIAPKPRVEKIPKEIDFEKNLARLRKRGIIKKELPTPRPTAREPGFDKIIKRLKKESSIAIKQKRPQKIKSNIKFLEQKGIGRVASVKGKKFIGRLGKKKGIKFEDFSSISSVFTKDQLSLIVGKSITNSKAKSEFIGIIRGAKKASGSSVGGSIQQKQYKKALNKVISAVASASGKAEKTKPLKQVTKNIATSVIISKIPRVPTKAIIKMAKVKIVKPKIRVTRTQIKKVKGLQARKGRIIRKEKQIVRKISKVKQKIKQLSKQKSKPKTKVKQRAVQKQAQLQKQKVRLRTETKQITKQIRKTSTPTRVPRVPRIPRKPKLKKKKVIKIKRIPRRQQAYNVFARPLKKRKVKGIRGKKIGIPKQIKVNKVPLKKPRAKDLRNFITDTSLSRTGSIRKTKGKPKTSRLKVPRGYAKKTSNKFRRTKRVKGKVVKLPKGKVIERSKRLLDTTQEKKKIGLRRRIAQIRKPKKKIKRTSSNKRITRSKPRPQPRQTKPKRTRKPVRKPTKPKSRSKPTKRRKR